MGGAASHHERGGVKSGLRDLFNCPPAFSFAGRPGGPGAHGPVQQPGIPTQPNPAQPAPLVSRKRPAEPPGRAGSLPPPPALARRARAGRSKQPVPPGQNGQTPLPRRPKISRLPRGWRPVQTAATRPPAQTFSAAASTRSPNISTGRLRATHPSPGTPIGRPLPAYLPGARAPRPRLKLSSLSAPQLSLALRRLPLPLRPQPFSRAISEGEAW
ncbi:hypothetical protein GQ55_7G208700 [Panicum hallii var. hallii]|uniref:Uncharacterized protein n=1 Tax=Panicum hallii var. hallii TaxID=1504633 RepID=A0A2T7CXC7_9POAL|nr:hypothetical protein GQ55_7G208700 [Panicum hallii var. hallii]